MFDNNTCNCCVACALLRLSNDLMCSWLVSLIDAFAPKAFYRSDSKTLFVIRPRCDGANASRIHNFDNSETRRLLLFSG